MALLPFSVPPSPFRRSSSTLIIPALSTYTTLRGNAGGFTLIGGTDVTDILTLQGTSGNGTSGNAAIQLKVGNNGATTALTVLNSGNVGIGTTNPSVKLDVSSGTAGTPTVTRIRQADNTSGFSHAQHLVEVGGTSGGDPLTIYRVSGATDWSVGVDNSDSDKLKIGPNTAVGTSTSITIQTDGNVGIGTTAPLKIAHITSTGTSTTLGQLNTNLRLQTNTTTVNAGSELSFMGRGGGTATEAALTYAAISAPVTANDLNLGTTGYLAFSTKPLTTSTSLTEAMRITSAGNVGIGTTNPSNKLHVLKTASGRAWSSDSNDIFILENSVATSFDFITTSTNASFLLFSDNDARARGWVQYNHSNDSLDFRTAGVSSRLVISSTGGVGVGLNPSAVLHLKAGTATANTAPLKFTSGTSLTAAEAGAIEFTTDDLFFTITTGTARKRLLMADAVGGLTSGRVPFATTNGRLTDDDDMTFATDTLSVTKAAVKAGTSSGNIAKVGGVLPADNFADVTVGGTEADIYSYTTPANTFGTNGDKIIASYGGNFVTVGTELTQLKVYFAGTAIWDSTGVAPSTGTTSWAVSVEIIMVSSTVVRYNVRLNTTGASGYVYNTVGELTGLTLSGTNILKITGASSGVGSGAGDIIGKMGFVRFDPVG